MHEHRASGANVNVAAQGDQSPEYIRPGFEIPNRSITQENNFSL